MGAVAVLPWALGYTGAVYGVTATLFSIVFGVFAWRVLRDKQDDTGRSLTGDMPARHTFKFSLLYLAVLFLALGVDHVIGIYG
jgi:protoheme IX farnesyltransferase